MSYQILTVPASHKALKKLPKSVRQHLIRAVEVLKTNPHHGEKLESPWRGFRSFHTNYRNTRYRVVYEVDESKEQIIIRYAGSREGFYKQLRRLHLKPQSGR